MAVAVEIFLYSRGKQIWSLRLRLRSGLRQRGSALARVFTAGLKSDPTSEATATAKEKATAVRWLKEPSGLAGCGSGAGPSTALRFAQDDDVFLVLEKPKPKPKSKSQLKAKAKAKPKPKPKAKQLQEQR